MSFGGGPKGHNIFHAKYFVNDYNFAQNNVYTYSTLTKSIFSKQISKQLQKFLSCSPKDQKKDRIFLGSTIVHDSEFKNAQIHLQSTNLFDISLHVSNVFDKF